MRGAREHDPVRTTAAAESVSGGRVVPAGAEGAVLDARRDRCMFPRPREDALPPRGQRG